MDNHFRGQF